MRCGSLATVLRFEYIRGALELVDELGERVLRRREAPQEAMQRAVQPCVVLGEMVRLEPQARPASDLQRHRRRDPGDMIEVGYHHALAPELPIELPAERIGGGYVQTAARREVTSRKAQQRHRVVHVLDDVAREHDLESLAKIRIRGC